MVNTVLVVQPFFHGTFLKKQVLTYQTSNIKTKNNMIVAMSARPKMTSILVNIMYEHALVKF